ncbi:TapB family protein [Deinococcus sedimenti]|uniref:DUF3108 domain-containing protein n=1 Tax=Deinococcus sedimenti TaxID=1867090 RepID=A0ABQ2S1S5_9DEIO|nr:hypothetical protein [Deinococcus sedimenti]GGR80455.1 hypothetical protein GCM10008960_04140 [Deinococcus sedimenti]
MRPLTRFILTATLAAVASPAAQAACTLKDMFPSGTYTYQMTGAAKGTVTTTNAVKGDSVTSTSTVAGTTTTTTWTCTAKGITSTLSSGGASSVTTSTAAMPPLNTWRPGYTWKSAQDLKMDGGITAKSTSVSKIVNRESVKVPAGTFNAWRLDTTTTVTMKLPSSSTPKTTTVKTSVWYAPGTGMIRTSLSGVTMELLKVKR